MQLDDDGLFVHDDPTQLANFTSYGADVLAVAPGKVVGVLDALPDQPPGAPPDSAAASFESADGNYVVIDLGNGSFAFYGNLQPGSLLVKVGDRVQRRQVLATLGNSGDSSFPHLSFRLMSSASPFGSDGLPFVFNGFSYEGQLDSEQVQHLGRDRRTTSTTATRTRFPCGASCHSALRSSTSAPPGGSGAVGRT